MSRNLNFNAVCLRARLSGESNREAWFLCAEEGIIKATVFGGPKSKLRAQVASFHQGKLLVYHDPVKNSNKVTDFDVHTWRPGLGELYERVMAANSLAETVLATHAGGGAWSSAMKLAGDALDCLENADEKTCPRILLHFFWAWTEFLGIRPDPGHCSGCACEASPDGLIWYNPKEGNFYCGKCRGSAFAGSSGSDITVGAGARRWLSAVEKIWPKDAVRYSLDKISFEQARSLTLSVLTESLGRRLPLWDY